MYEDKTLVCKECGQEFVFTAGEQEFYAERGFQYLRCLRRRGQGALRAQVRSSRLLQRLLRPYARRAELICNVKRPPRLGRPFSVISWRNRRRDW